MYCTCKKSVHVYSVKNNREVPGALTTWLRLLCLHPSLLGPLPPSGWDPPPLECAPLAGFVFLWRGHTHSWALPDFELDLSGATCVRPRDSRGHPRLCPAPPARQPGRPPWPPVPHHSPGPLSPWSSGEGDVAACVSCGPILIRGRRAAGGRS